MDVFRNRHTVTFLGRRHSTGPRSTPLSSASISQAKEKPSILPISPSPVIRHLGSVTSGQAVRGIISEDWKSWAGVIDSDNHECMTFGSIQTPDCKTLDNMGKSLVDWYRAILSVEKTSYRAYPKRWSQTCPFPRKLSYTMLICLNGLFACVGLTLTCKLLTNFSKNSFYLLPEPLRIGEFLTNYCQIGK